ncbi:hypothetical protein J6590_033982 [Homalodisca vitripennis]|nr:hypothetical protein J6590_033982 [Homalodisca vitripennis]
MAEFDSSVPDILEIDTGFHQIGNLSGRYGLIGVESDLGNWFTPPQEARFHCFSAVRPVVICDTSIFEILHGACYFICITSVIGARKDIIVIMNHNHTAMRGDTLTLCTEQKQLAYLWTASADSLNSIAPADLAYIDAVKAQGEARLTQCNA